MESNDWWADFVDLAWILVIGRFGMDFTDLDRNFHDLAWSLMIGGVISWIWRGLL